MVGDTVVVEVSALQGIGIDDLLENLLVVAELEDLRGNTDGRAVGVVLEANLDIGRGPVATVLVQQGTLHVGDPLVAGAVLGPGPGPHRRQGRAGQGGRPVHAGAGARPLRGGRRPATSSWSPPTRRRPPRSAATREHWQRQASLGRDAHAMSGGAKLEDIFQQIQAGEAATLNLIIKADVTGSLEALTESLRKLERDDVKLAFVRRGVGGITKDDIQLAATSNATIIGFNVRPDRNGPRAGRPGAGVEIRTYEIIYQVLEDIENAMLGMLAPEFEEVVTGDAEVREVFRVPRIGAIAGCYVTNGVITRGSKVRFLREGTDHLEGRHQLAAPVQGRRPRGAVRLRVRHRPLRLPGPQARRHHRDLRGSGDPAGLAAGRGPATVATHVLALTIDLRIPEAQSLKEKRSVVTPILEGARRRFQVAASETGRVDQHGRSELAFVGVSGSATHTAQLIDSVERFVWSFPEVEVVASERDWLEVDSW